LTPLLPCLYLVPFLSFLHLGRRTPRLSHHAPSQARPLSVVIPARNESANIGAVVSSILQSTYHPLEVVVLDDRSSDDTAATVRGLMPGDPRLRVVTGSDLPDGWLGKPWACVQGYRETSGELIVFTDADTRHQPDLLGFAVGALEAENAALVTIVPRVRCVTFWERVVMPQIFYLLAMRFLPRRINQARRIRDVIANGQFILVTRASYERVGTHAAVRGAVAEDLALAQAYFRQGYRLHGAFAEDLMETRMYRTLRELVNGWSKNIFLGSRESYPAEPWRRALAPLVLVGVMLYWLAPVALVGFAMSGVASPVDAMAALISCIVFWSLFPVAMKIPPWYGLGYPLGAAAVLFIVLRSIWRGSSRVEWRGRVSRNVGRVAETAGRPEWGGP